MRLNLNNPATKITQFSVISHSVFDSEEWVFRSCLKKGHSSFYIKSAAIKIAQNVTKYLGYFRKKICAQEFSKVAQSCHTAETWVPSFRRTMKLLPSRQLWAAIKNHISLSLLLLLTYRERQHRPLSLSLLLKQSLPF